MQEGLDIWICAGLTGVTALQRLHFTLFSTHTYAMPFNSAAVRLLPPTAPLLTSGQILPA